MRNTILSSIFILFSIASVWAQETKPLSLQQAVDHALEHSMRAKSNKIDIEQAKKDVWVQAARGLPQINGAVNFNNFIQIPTTVAPADAFGFPDYLTEFLGGVSAETGVPINAPAPGESETTEFQFGQRYNMDVGATASQILFDGSYIIGVKGAKGFQKLTKDRSKLTENEIVADVEDAYYTALVSQENTKLLEANLSNMEETLNETSALFDNGFAEEMDVEQLELLVTQMRNRIQIAQRQEQATRNLLKYTMGMEIQTSIELTDNLENLWDNVDVETILGNEFNPENNIAYDLVKQDITLHGYLVKLEEAKYYPRLSAFFDYKQQAFRNDFSFFDFSQKWFPQTLWGIQLRVPIWDNLGNAASIQKAKLEQQRVRNRLYDTEQGLKLKYFNTRDNFVSAMEELENERNNIDLSKRIRDKVLIKYNEGLATSMELTTAENQLISSQGNYINALFKVMDAKVELKKILENTY